MKKLAPDKKNDNRKASSNINLSTYLTQKSQKVPSKTQFQYRELSWAGVD